MKIKLNILKYIVLASVVLCTGKPCLADNKATQTLVHIIEDLAKLKDGMAELVKTKKDEFVAKTEDLYARITKQASDTKSKAKDEYDELSKKNADLMNALKNATSDKEEEARQAIIKNLEEMIDKLRDDDSTKEKHKSANS